MTPPFLRVPHPSVPVRGARSVAAAVVLIAALAACSPDEPADEPSGASSAAPSESSEASSDGPNGPNGSDGSEVEAAQPGERATTYPVPAEVSAEPLPDLGTLETGEWTLTLNGASRVGDQALAVTGTLTSNGPTVFAGFEEPGFSLRETDGGKLENTYEFSAVTVSVEGDPAVYQVMRDADGLCACTQGVLEAQPDAPMAVYAYVTAPADATTVDVTVAGIGTFEDVEVQA